MKSYYKLISGLAVLITIVTGLWLFWRYEAIKASVYEARRVDIAAHIQGRAAALIKAEAFNNQDPLLQQQIFESFFDAVQTPEIFRIKVFDRRLRIIWSNVKELIGQDAANNREALDALKEGKITLKFHSLKPEQVSERQFREFTEIYVPIRYGKGQIVGVIEVYQTALPAKKTIRTEFQKSLIQAAAIALLGYLVAALILRLFMRHRGDVQG